MRAFIVLCLVAVACADKLGYNYRPVEHSDSGLSFAPGGGSGGLGGAGVGPAEYGPAQSGPAQSGPSYNAPAAEYEKEFFTYTADEAEFNEPAGNDVGPESLKKNLRVIFIKGPEGNGLENAAVNLAKLAAEERTAIYVLQKQADLGEDAVNAQRAIQSQYDQLGGKSQSHDGGAAPVHNFASPAAQPAPRPVSAPGAAYLPSSILRF
ncbi:unnamed protein product [Ceratitis capitata]|uniref:(Mediterranean fruit fly) hypothetical protein n=1 Tax=Ceratitis capitata TaxID=7213 RepID=A0A811U7T7_CERCA|nr:unnamed protein product [Ceratitis capitata]